MPHAYASVCIATHTVQCKTFHRSQILQTPDSPYISVYLPFTLQYLSQPTDYKHRKIPMPHAYASVYCHTHTQFSALPFSAHRLSKLRIVLISMSSCHTHCNTSHNPQIVQTPVGPCAACLRQCHCHSHCNTAAILTHQSRGHAEVVLITFHSRAEWVESPAWPE